MCSKARKILLAAVKRAREWGGIVFPWEGRLQHYEAAFEDTPGMKTAGCDSKAADPEPRRGHCSAGTEEMIPPELQGHGHSSHSALEGAAPHQLQVHDPSPWTGQSSSRDNYHQEPRAGWALPWKGNPDPSQPKSPLPAAESTEGLQSNSQHSRMQGELRCSSSLCFLHTLAMGGCSHTPLGPKGHSGTPAMDSRLSTRQGFPHSLWMQRFLLIALQWKHLWAHIIPWVLCSCNSFTSPREWSAQPHQAITHKLISIILDWLAGVAWLSCALLVTAHGDLHQKIHTGSTQSAGT